MDRNQAKEFYPILQAFAEGMVIECRTKPSAIEDENVPNEWAEIKVIKFNGNKEYRIKPNLEPESEYRPFKDAKECWQEMQKHQPFGWLKSSEGYYFQIVSMGKTFIGGTVDSSGRIVPNSYRCLYNSYTFTDGLPFGVKVQE